MLLARFLQIALLFSRHLIKLSLNRLSWIECRSYDHFIRSSSKLSHKSADSKMLRHSNPLWSRFKIFMDRVVRDHLVPTSSKISCHIPIMAPSTTTTIQFKDRIWWWLDILFLSNHNIHKSSFGLCFSLWV